MGAKDEIGPHVWERLPHEERRFLEQEYERAQQRTRRLREFKPLPLDFSRPITRHFGESQR